MRGHAARRVVARRDLAREPGQAQAVGPVRRDFEVDDGVVFGASGEARPRRHLEARHVQVAWRAGRRSPARPPARAARRPGPSQRELLQEAQVVLVEQADVLDAVHQQREPLDADAEAKPV